MRMLAHGVTMNAISGDQNIAALEPIGIGRMCMRPHQSADEGAISNTAAITRERGPMVGLPTSPTARRRWWTSHAPGSVADESGGQ